MTPETSQESQARRLAAATVSHYGRDTSSRMFENYLADLDYLIAEGLWKEALPLALALPHLCIALADPTLQSSRERFTAWCATWLHPIFPESIQPVPAAEELFALSREKQSAAELDSTASVPVESLRKLQLRRLARRASTRLRPVVTDISVVSGEAMHSVCVYLMHAASRWYDEWAAFDETVQRNLARLAVLR